MAVTRELQVLLNPSRRVRMLTEVISFVLCFAVAMVQMAVLDYYFLHYTGNNFAWLGWIGGDLVVAAVMTWLLVKAVKYNDRCSKTVCKSDANLQYAFIAWLVYSLVLSGKIASAVWVYASQLTTQLLFGFQVYRLTLSGSCVVFLLLVMSHHYTRLNSPRQAYLSYLTSSVTLDILDSVMFLDLMYKLDPVSGAVSLKVDDGMRITVLFFACLNFVLPTFALFKLRYNKGLPKWICLPYEKLYTLVYFLVVNIPYGLIRIYLWATVAESDIMSSQHGGMSIFIVKNVIMTIIGIRELWVAYLIAQENKIDADNNSGGSGNEGQPERLQEVPACSSLSEGERRTPSAP